MCSALTASVQAQNFLPGNGYARISLNSLFWYNVLLLIKEIVTLQEHSWLGELHQPRGLCWIIVHGVKHEHCWEMFMDELLAWVILTHLADKK